MISKSQHTEEISYCCQVKQLSVCVYLMSGYLDTRVVTSRNSSVGSVSLNTSAMAAMAPQSRSVSSPYTQQATKLAVPIQPQEGFSVV